MTVKLVRRGKVGRTAAELLKKKRQNRHQKVIFDVMSEILKDSQVVSAVIGQFLPNLTYKLFVRNLMSKLARSTSTSPG
jgi:hypothetical protein